jgi:hypothetical protein
VDFAVTPLSDGFDVGNARTLLSGDPSVGRFGNGSLWNWGHLSDDSESRSGVGAKATLVMGKVAEPIFRRAPFLQKIEFNFGLPTSLEP